MSEFIGWLKGIDWPSWLTAIGTLAVAILAIWGEWIKSYIAGPRLGLVPHNLQGELTEAHRRAELPGGVHGFQRIPAVYFHLRVLNNRSWAPAHGVRVLFVGLLRRDQSGIFHREPINVRQQLTWAPAEFSGITPVIIRDHVLDLGCLTQDGFRITTYATPNNFRGTVGAHEAIRVELQIVADDYYSDRVYVYEIAWDGVWAADLSVLAQHVSVQEIASVQNSMGIAGGEILAEATTGRSNVTPRRPRVFFRAGQFLWRIPYRVQEIFLEIVSTLTQFLALRFSPIVLPLLLVSLGLLIWNRDHLQAPGWIATSFSVVCGGIISLLAMEKAVRKNKYLIGMVLLFMFIPAFLGCWVVLRPEGPLEEEVSYLTLFDQGRSAVFPSEETQKMLGFRPYMVLLGKLYEVDTSEKGKETTEQEIRRHIEATRADVRVDEVLILSQMQSLFYKSWAVNYRPVSRHSGVYISGVSPEIRGFDLSNEWTKAKIEKVLPDNPYIAKLPVDFKIILPPGMKILLEKNKDARTLVFEDAHCKVSFHRGSWHYGVSSVTGHSGAREGLYIQANDIVVTTIFKRFLIGTDGTVQRKRLWMQPLLKKMRDEFVGVKFSAVVESETDPGR